MRTKKNSFPELPRVRRPRRGMSFTQLPIPVRPRKGLPFQDIKRLVRFSISSPQGTSWYLLILFRELSLTPHGYVSDMAFEFYIFVRLWLKY
jgi:hypothetical protein